VDAYINKKSINYVANTITQHVDFTAVTNTTYFGGFFSGHLHSDTFFKHKTLTDIFGYEVQCLNTVDPNITGSQDIRPTNDGNSGSDCVTVVSIDALHKKLGLAKIGDTITVHGRKRDYAVIDTSNGDYIEYNMSITKGITSNRPTTNLIIGYQYFDTTLKKPIWYSGTGWVDSTGTTV